MPKNRFKSSGEHPFAVITGGSSGMGLEYARQLAEAGCRLLIVSNRKEELRKAAEEIGQKYGSEPLWLEMDLARETAAEELYEYCRKEYIDADILVNNAGMFFFRELSLKENDKITQMLYLHTFTTTRLCLLFGEDMKRRGSGYILNVSSVAALLSVPGISLYASTKSYLRTFSRSLYYEFKPYGVNVSVVCPGAVATPLYGLNGRLMKIGMGVGLIKRPEVIVRRALRGLSKGKRTINPSLMSYYLPPLVSMIPKCMVLKFWKKYGWKKEA